MTLIPSEEQAIALGERRTGGKEGEDFAVFSYRNKPSGITFFAVEIVVTKDTIKHLDAGMPVQIVCPTAGE